LKLVLPSLVRARELDERLTAHRRATHLLVHLFDYHRREKKFPKSLDELKVANLKELRIDPFSGKDFVYIPQEDGFKLYSVFDNMKDDDGVHNATADYKTGDLVFWPVPD